MSGKTSAPVAALSAMPYPSAASASSRPTSGLSRQAWHLPAWSSSLRWWRWALS